jgi:crossover junction endodeoxyribonuclease RuvC
MWTSHFFMSNTVLSRKSLCMARKNARTLWADKIIKGLDASPGAVMPGIRPPYVGVVLGIDPSLRGTGLAVLEFNPASRDGPVLCASRTLRLGVKLSMPDCLGEIYKAVADAIEDWPVRHVALEQTIYVQNFQTAQILGAARGAAIAAASVLGKPVFEYPPLRVKQAVVGFGRASKEQVGGMMSSLFHLADSLSFDESDAAAVAFCHANSWRE